MILSIVTLVKYIIDCVCSLSEALLLEFPFFLGFVWKLLRILSSAVTSSSLAIYFLLI